MRGLCYITYQSNTEQTENPGWKYSNILPEPESSQPGSLIKKESLTNLITKTSSHEACRYSLA